MHQYFAQLFISMLRHMGGTNQQFIIISHGMEGEAKRDFHLVFKDCEGKNGGKIFSI